LRNSSEELGEARRLTAAWLNIMAASLVSAGFIPVLTAFVVEGWSDHARSLALLPVLTVSAGTGLHIIGRFTLRQKRAAATPPSPSPQVTQTPGKAGGVTFPTERDIDELLEEFGQDSRAAIAALLHDMSTLASDECTSDAGEVQAVRPEPARAKPSKLRR